MARAGLTPQRLTRAGAELADEVGFDQVTVSALAAARKAADGGDFDRATAAAREAEALAKASIFQATSEKEAWKAMEIR